MHRVLNAVAAKLHHADQPKRDGNRQHHRGDEPPGEVEAEANAVEDGHPTKEVAADAAEREGHQAQLLHITAGSLSRDRFSQSW